ncbi:EamA family transporter [Ignatzschineria ureiclastica]|uniref:EamA family transporter n=1 Tax=Ignatzschineria ureiclastica TaxID=472582 RepID=A0A2U2AE32_9GAMM|nr:DMT family transporter [Ignatzschineria ureiclastica]PWD80916.1 EamA family transporter [Ignatzschineria ureiclastica]GGZ93907.1 multidrug DMT transporter [Ignatzschineria ureiclastica]
MNPYLFPFFAVSIWAFNTIVSKLSVGVVNAEAMAFYRWFFAFLVLTPFVIRGIRQEIPFLRTHFWKVAVLGFLRIVLYQSIIYYAVQMVPATTLAIFGGLVPILILLFGTFLLRTPVTIWLISGFLLAFLGVIYLSTKGELSNLIALEGHKGEFLLLISSSAYALYTVLVKRWSLEINTWNFLYLQIGIGLVILFPFFIYQGHYALSFNAAGLIAYAAIPASLIAPYLWLRGVAQIGANRSALFLNLTPLLTITLAILILQEPIDRYLLIGGGLILLGIATTFIPNRQATKAGKITV